MKTKKLQIVLYDENGKEKVKTIIKYVAKEHGINIAFGQLVEEFKKNIAKIEREEIK